MPAEQQGQVRRDQQGRLWLETQAPSLTGKVILRFSVHAFKDIVFADARSVNLHLFKIIMEIHNDMTTANREKKTKVM